MNQVRNKTLTAAITVVICFAAYYLMMVVLEPGSYVAGIGAAVIVVVAVLVGRYLGNYVETRRQAS